MAWRIAEYIVRGEIDNRLPGIIEGTLYLEWIGANGRVLIEGAGFTCD